jgi:hypothetical protein
MDLIIYDRNKSYVIGDQTGHYNWIKTDDFHV